MPATNRTDTRSSRAWRNLRRYHLATQPWVCWRCGRPINSASEADLGHVIGLEEPSLVALEHRRCNRQAGQADSQERKAQARNTPPQWTTSEL